MFGSLWDRERERETEKKISTRTSILLARIYVTIGVDMCLVHSNKLCYVSYLELCSSTTECWVMYTESLNMGIAWVSATHAYRERDSAITEINDNTVYTHHTIFKHLNDI